MDNFRTFLIFGLLIVSLLLWEAWQNDYVRPQQAAQATAIVYDDSLPAIDPAKNDLPDMPVARSLDSLPELSLQKSTVSANNTKMFCIIS